MPFRRFAAPLFVLLAAGLAPRAAHAFCRTVTEAAPADYNPLLTGCFRGNDTNAKFLYWKNACVGYSLQQDASKQVTLQQAEDAMSRAFGEWSDATCSDGGHPSISARDEGPVACGLVQYNQAEPNQHVIVFRDDGWPHSDPNNTLALTTVTFDLNTGELYDADMEINSHDSKIVASGTVPPGAFDFDSIVTHEAGHFLGLAHSADIAAVMYAHYKPGSTHLTSDDVAGICAIYPSSGMRETSQGELHEDPCDPTPRHGFGTQCGTGKLPDPTTQSKGGCSAAPTGANRAGNFGLVALGIAGLFAARRRRRATDESGRAAGGRPSATGGDPAPRGATLPAMNRVRAGATAVFLSLAAVGAAGATSFVARDAHASVSIAVLFDDLVRDASAAAVVTPMEQRSVWENGRIYTYTRVHVDSSVAGALPEEPWVRTMGGAVGKIGQLVEGEAVLTVGRPTLLFLQPQLDEAKQPIAGNFLVTARAQGQFPVKLDGAGKQRFMRAYGVGALVAPPAERVQRVAQMRRAAGVDDAAPLASDVLHDRPVEEATRAIVLAWTRLHGTPQK